MPARQSSEYILQNRTKQSKIQNVPSYVHIYNVHCKSYILGPSFFLFFLGLLRGEGVRQGRKGGPLSMNTTRQNCKQNYAYLAITEHVRQCKGGGHTVLYILCNNEKSIPAYGFKISRKKIQEPKIKVFAKSLWFPQKNGLKNLFKIFSLWILFFVISIYVVAAL